MESPTIGKLAEALSKAQGEMGPAIKDKSNPFYKSKYADLSSVIEVIREPLSRHGIARIQYIRSDKEDQYLMTKLLHISGEWIESEIKLILTKKDMQGLGSAITYARRYALVQMVGLSEMDDDGNSAVEKQEIDLSHLGTIMRQKGIIMNDLIKRINECFGISDPDNLSSEQIAQTIKWIEGLKK